MAGPGDTIYIKQGHVYRKAAGSTAFKEASEGFIKPCGTTAECNFPVPAGTWYLLGDNRGESDDSRFWGPVPTAWIVGVVTGVDCRDYPCPDLVSE